MSTLNPHEFNVHGFPPAVQLKESAVGIARWLMVSNPVLICQNVSASASVPARRTTTGKKASQAKNHDLPLLPTIASLTAELSRKFRAVASTTRRPLAGEPRCGHGIRDIRAAPEAGPALRAVRDNPAARKGPATGPPPQPTRQRWRARGKTRFPRRTAGA